MKPIIIIITGFLSVLYFPPTARDNQVINTGTAEWLPTVLCDDLNKICKLNRILSKTNSPVFYLHIF